MARMGNPDADAETTVKEEPADDDAWTDQDWAEWEAGWWEDVKVEDPDPPSSGNSWQNEELPQQTDEKTSYSSMPENDHEGYGSTTHWGYFKKEFGDVVYGSGKGYGSHRQYNHWRKGFSKGKQKTKSKHRKPMWAYQNWKANQMAAGKAANKGKRDSFGGVYTSSGYRDCDGTEWEYLGKKDTSFFLGAALWNCTWISVLWLF